MLRVLMLSADVMEKPMGGLGEHVREVACQIVKKRIACVDVISPLYGVDRMVAEHVCQRFAFMLMRSKPNLRKTHHDILRHQAEMVARSMVLPRPNIVHAHDWPSFDAGRIISRCLGAPLVVTVHLSCHDLFIPIPGNQVPELRTHAEDMERMGLAEANAICHVSDYYKSKLGKELGMKSVVCGNGINPEPWFMKHEPMKLPGNRPKKLVYVGRIAHMKNVDTLLDIKLPEDVDLCIIGGEQGSDAWVWKKLVESSRNRPDVHMVGPLYGQDKIRAMKSATAGIFPSRKEPFGIVGLEWMMSGVPFVASYVDGMNEYIGDDVAIPCGITRHQMEEAVRQACLMGDDERIARGVAGIKRAYRFSWSTVADCVLEAYAIAQANGGVMKNGDVLPPRCP